MPMGADGTSYSTKCRSDGKYEIVMTKIDGMPEIVELFATDAEAEHWILEQIQAKGKELPNIIT